jgi:hypothetical protein
VTSASIRSQAFYVLLTIGPFATADPVGDVFQVEVVSAISVTSTICSLPSCFHADARRPVAEEHRSCPVALGHLADVQPERPARVRTRILCISVFLAANSPPVTVAMLSTSPRHQCGALTETYRPSKEEGFPSSAKTTLHLFGPS